jgi:hypothetical protein
MIVTLPVSQHYSTVSGILVRYNAGFLFIKGVFKVFLSVQVFIQNPGGPDSAWNLPDELSVGQAVQIRVSPQGPVKGLCGRCLICLRPLPSYDPIPPPPPRHAR